MKKTAGDPDQTAGLDLPAESSPSLEPAPISILKTQEDGLLHQLQVRQVELELQNAELRQNQEKLKTARDRYDALFNFAPWGCCVLDQHNRILEANSTFSQMVGISRAELLNTAFENYIQRHDQDIFDLHRQSLPSQDAARDCELHLLNRHTGPFFARLACTIDGAEPHSTRIAIQDISNVKEASDKILHQSSLTRQLVAATQRLNTQYELAPLLNVIDNDLSQIFNMGAVGIALYDPADNMLKFFSINGRPPQSQTWYSYIRHEFFVKNDQSVLEIPDIRVLSDGPNYALIQALDIRNMIIVNLRSEQRPVGAIHIGSVGQVRRFDEEEMAFLATYGHHAASAIERARLFDETRQRTSELEILARLSARFGQAATSKELLPLLLKEAVAATNAVVGKIFMVERGEDVVDYFQVSAPSAAGEDWFNPGEPLWAKALADETGAIQSEILSLADQPAQAGPPPHRLIEKIAVTLRANQTVMGLVALGFAGPFISNERVYRVARAVADMAGNALNHTRLMEMLEQRVASRTREISTLYDLTLLTNSPGSLEQMLLAALKKVLLVSEAQAAGIYKYEKALARLTLVTQEAFPEKLANLAGTILLPTETISWLEESTVPKLIFSGNPDSVQILPGTADFQTGVYVVIRYEKKALGMLCILWQSTKDLSVENISLIGAAAERLGSAIQNRALGQQAEQAAILEERRRLAHDLHDSVAQSIYSLTLLSEAGKDLAARGEQARLVNCLEDLQQSSIQAMREMRLLLFELRPPQDKGFNLAQKLKSRLESVENRSRVRVEFRSEGEHFLTPSQEEELYRVASEALNNSLKHSASNIVKIWLQASNNEYTMEIEDQGCGFDLLARQHSGIGLSSMRERVENLGGDFQIVSQIGRGTRVIVRLRIPFI